MIFALHARGRWFETLTANISQVISPSTIDERAFALVHGHLLDFTPFSAISGPGGVFYCPRTNPPSRAYLTPGINGHSTEGVTVYPGANNGDDL